jgi:hypothetical protein
MTQENLWQTFLDRFAEFQAIPTSENGRLLGIAYADFVEEFCPEQADDLIAEYGLRLHQYVRTRA